MKDLRVYRFWYRVMAFSKLNGWGDGLKDTFTEDHHPYKLN